MNAEDAPGRCSGSAGLCTDQPACIWTGPHGGKYGLCDMHAAEWRVQTAGTPVAPVKIQNIRGQEGSRP